MVVGSPHLLFALPIQQEVARVDGSAVKVEPWLHTWGEVAVMVCGEEVRAEGKGLNNEHTVGFSWRCAAPYFSTSLPPLRPLDDPLGKGLGGTAPPASLRRGEGRGLETGGSVPGFAKNAIPSWCPSTQGKRVESVQVCRS